VQVNGPFRYSFSGEGTPEAGATSVPKPELVAAAGDAKGQGEAGAAEARAGGGGGRGGDRRGGQHSRSGGQRAKPYPNHNECLGGSQ